ncbi:nucleoid-associated protein [Empedobacter brevis]
MSRVNLSNTYIRFLTLQKVGHKVREESNILATKTTEYQEAKEEDLLPFLLNPFKKYLEQKQFSHYTNKLEFNKVYNLCKSAFDEEIDFVDFSNEILKSLYDQSLHPMIKSGEVFITLFENVMFDDIPCRGIGIYKLENKSKFIRFDERQEIDYDVLKGYKLDKIDKAVLILDVFRDEGNRVYSIDDHNVESEFWTKKFLDVSSVKNSALQTKEFIEVIEEFSKDVVLDKSDKKNQTEFVATALDLLSNNEFVTNEIFEEQLLKPFEIIEEFKEYKKNYSENNRIEFDESFEVDTPTLIKESKKIKSDIKLDTGAKINIDLQKPECSAENLERGFDDERKMYYYKLFFNAEQ